MAHPASTPSSGPAGGAREPGPGRREYAGEACLNEIIAAQCERTPGRVAVSFEGTGLTYRELLARARALAGRLRRLGAGPETLVGLCAERSLEAVVALLAILETGAAYVPLDPSYPAERLAWMLEESATPVLLTQRHLAGSLPPHHARVVFLEESTGPEPSPGPAPSLHTGPFPESLAYVIYTSGSTGRPKGTMNGHWGVRNRLLWMRDVFGMREDDHVLQKTPFSFDVSVWEVFATLMAGARLVIARPGGHHDMAYLADLIAREGITIAHFVPAMLRLFLDAEGLERCASLKHVVCSGEALPADLERRFFERFGTAGPELHNLYGPTEAAVEATWWRCRPDGGGASVPIGLPMPNVTIHLLGPDLEPAPADEPAALYIGGVAPGRGYHRRPDLTAEKFIPDPLSDTPGGRLYATGDLARRLSDGNFDFLGRIDHQVKINGVRIELGEIEAELAAHPAVRAQVVVARQHGNGAPRLIAYVVTAAPCGAAELRAFLRRRLPGAMVPPEIVFLDALPLSPNGKIDRKALPEPPRAVREHVEPRTPLERRLAELWQEVLGVQRVGRDDSFLELGGTSLKGTVVVSRLQRELGQALPAAILFETPTLAGLAEQIAAAAHGGRPAAAPVTPAARGAESPLSYAQQRLWLIDRFEGGGTALYNVPVAFRIAGPGLRVPPLASALAEIVRRHEALRTAFRESAEGEPVQAVQPFTAPRLPVIDLAGLPGARSAAGTLARELAVQPFDLARGPLLRCSLLRLGAEEHHLIAVLHHIVSDGWSLEILARELSELYQAFAEGLPSPLPPLPVQYADFAIWQRRWLTGEVLAGELAWWRERLAGLPPALELPTDRPRPARQSFRGGSRHARLDPRTGAALAALGRRHGATLFMTALAAFYTLLHRYTGEEDLAAGTPAAGRGSAETQGLIGFFVNTLVLRTSLAGDPGFLELLARARTAVLDAGAHQDLPFEQLAAALAPRRDLARTPLFQVMLTFWEQAPGLKLGPGLTATMAELPTATAQLDMSLQVSRDGDELSFTAEYATGLFDAATIDRLLGHLGTLLEGIAVAPETRLSLLPLLTQPEREQLAAWNATEEPRPAGATLHGLFAAQAARTPDAVAVIAREGTLTYRELDARAERLARRLAALGAGIDSPVGLFLERSPEMVVALLGVLKAGAAYVPLDPDYPAERLAGMLEDARPVAVLAQERLADRLPAGAPVLFLEAGWEKEAGGNLPAIVPEEAAAYLIFTSGSTGRPKAATVPHRAIVNHMLWMQAEFPLEPADRVLQKTAFSFDASVWEFWAPLLAGAALVMARPGEQREPAALIRGIREHGVTVLQTVPSLLRALLEEGGLEECRSLRRVFCGGEALEAGVQADFFAAQGAELINLYGPTETTVEVTFWRCERAREPRPALVGGPIPNARLHVLGDRLEPCPVGVPGELFVGGTPVSRGYLGRPAETAASFLPDPFAAAPGERLYRTGDRVRRRPDGLLEYLGRADGQVKVRGFRVELGEVEAAIAAHPGVQAVAAVVREDLREDQPGDRRLVAYVVARNEAVTPAEIRRAARERLPEAMVPSLIVLLSALPLTPNGKVDRRALPSPEPVPGTGHELAAPRTHREEQVAALWRDVLKVDRLGVHDNFWELGGHSLLATRLAHRVRESFGVELPVHALFEHPTLARYTEAIAEALQGPGERADPITPRVDSGPAPLSHAQRRLWFLDRLQPGQAVYNLPVLFGISGPLAEDALAAALAETVRRHGALRTTFALDAESGEPVQVVAAPAPWPLPRVDLAGLPPALRAAEADRLLAAERRLPFDLARGPLLRALLVRLGPRDHRLALNVHHIISDGWSIGVLRRELQALYGAAVAGRPSPLPELAVQYADFAVWQRRWLAGGEEEAQLAWWRQTLAGTPPALDLPTDRPRPAVLSPRGGLETLPLGAALSAEVARLGRRRGTTQFMTLLAGLGTLLRRYTGQEDLWLGTPIANRQHAETENLLGFFANTLVLRLDLRGDPAFAELLGRVRETALAAYAHQDLPFDKLVEELAPARDLSRTPLFQAVFAAESERAAPAELAPGVTLETLPAEAGTAKFDLFLTVKPGPEGLEAAAEWATDLFDTATIRRLLAHFRLLLTEAAGNPGARISELPLLAAEERQQVLHAWNDTATDYPREATIPGLFAEQARRTPDAVAVVGGGEELTYAELNRRAERLAGWLVAAGLAPDEAVGLCAERSAGLIAALLGILKAGGAYVPLDPSYPRERLAGMLADAGARIVVAQEGLEHVLPASGARTLPLRGTLGAEGGPTARPALHPEQLAYVLFTSGSTGRPKGVAVTHRNVVRLVRETGYLHFGPEEVFLQLAPVSFDASTLEIWGPLLNGGRLALHPPGPLDLGELGEALERYGVTTLWLTAGLFHQMVESHLEGLRPVRQLAAGGDVLSPELVRRALAGLPGTVLVNGYGPTEGTTFTCCHAMRSEAGLGAGSVPVGRPIANTRVYLLDATFQPVPVGVVGQLHAAGDGLARGYAGRPELTAERFVPDPVSGEPGARLYATGDLARWRPSGEIEFLGRVDAQVKIRGFRIEPGEIEAALAAHPEVETALVMAREDLPGDKRLVAYVVPAAGSSPQPAALRAWTEERLPSYMVPAAFVPLSELPLGPTGKVDRRALPAPAWEPPEAGPAAERSPVEELLAGLWADLLGVPGAASHDSFFDLGGHSLLAVRLTSRIRAVLGVDAGLRTVFEHPTLAGLAAWIEAAARGGRPVAAPAAAQERGAESPLSYAQQRLWLVDRFESGGTALYNVPVAFHLAGPGLQIAALALALGEVVRRHEALRTVFRESAEGEPVQAVLPFTAVPLPVIDLAGLRDARSAAESLARELASRPFDLARGPLLRAWLLRLGGEEHQLVVSMHHIVSDGWSIETLVREISELYQAFAQGLPSPLPPLPLQYADFAIWQRQWLAGEVLETELAWWREQLAGMPPALELPADRPRPARQSFRGGLRHHRLELRAGELATLSRRHGATLFMTLAAAFDTLLLRYTGSEDLAIGTPIAGRGGAEIQGLIGFFVNTLVLRTSLAGDPGFRELLARTRAAALDAYAHQDLPFEQLVAALAPQRDPARTPLFQVVFALHETQGHELRLGPSLTGAMAEVPTATAKFDLYLHVSRDGDELRAAAEYATDLFDAATVDRLLGHLSTLLAGIAAAPETPLSLLPLLTQPEREQLRALWSGGEPAPLPAPTLPGLFAAQAARAPGALALVCGGETLTYAELDARSAALAKRLRRLGVGPEVPVGVCLPRTADLVAGLLAVLRAGGFYVPLDPVYPSERLGYMLADSRCRLALTVGETAAVLPTAAVRLVRLDDPALEEGSRDDADNPEVLPQNLAYLIYTSGSTGRPKAVAIEHRSAALLTGWARRVFSPAELAGVVASTSIAFDVSVFELFAPLTSGGTVILVENALAIPTLKAPGALPPGVEARVAPMVPSAAAELLRSGGLPATVSVLNLGGEALPRALAQRAYERPETGRVYNLYGPSEDTTYSTFAVIERGPGRTSPIGRPVDGTRAYVLDRRLQPMPAGVPGELYLAGGGLSRGYLGRPELTAERFLPDPLADEPGARMYKTGDLAFQRIGGEPGELEYLGRIDRQVKVRGFRIELGEVEAALAAHPGVQAVAAVVREDLREDQPGGHRLVAYVVASGEAATPAEIRRTAQARLPEAMVPSHVLLLDALPLSPNGKVDHRALPAPEALAGGGDELAAPRTHLEERLAELWRAVLNVERLGIHDSFWELGGHSLPAARLAHRVRETFGVELPVRTLFERPTLALHAEAIAAAIAEASRRPGEGAEHAIPRLEDGPAPLSYAQQRLWFLDRLQPGQAVYNLPVLFGVSGPLAADALAAALAEIVRRHEVLRTTFAMDAESGEPVQVVAAPAPWPLPRVDLAALPAELRAAEAERLLAAERHRPFDLARGPLLRTLLVRLAPRDHRLALNVHHIVFDGWSAGVLRRELQALYGAAVAGRPSPLPEPAIQYRDFSAWQRRWLAGGELAAQLAWWRRTLAGTPPVLDLPTDRPRPAVQSLRGGLEALPLGPELSAAVEQLGQRQGTTPFMTLLAAFQALLFRYTGQEDLWLGTPIANRAHAGTEDLLGFFVNTLVMRTSLAGDPAFAELLGRVRETALAAYAQPDLPFERLVEELAPARDLSRSPLFQVMFSYDGERMAPAALASGVTLEALDVTLDAAKFDLTLAVESGPEGLKASVEYAADLFDAATARRLLAHFHLLLAHAVDDPGVRIAELPLITPAEREELLAAGRRTAAPIPAEPVHRLFEARAQAAPEALAVSWPGGRLTYGELDRRANRLAHRLRELGAGPERVITILLERSPELVIAVLATLKAGGAWLPVDPAYPGERITTMLRDSGALALLTAAAPLARVPDLPLPAERVLRMDEPDSQEGSPAPPAVALDRDHLAYVIYTSGSTGTPKGTELTHGGLANLVAWHQRAYALSPADRSPLLAGLGFDASVWEMWPALAAGASLHLPPPDTIPSPAALLAWLAAERITVAFLPTPLAEAVLEEARTAPTAPALRAVLTGGDRLLRRPPPGLPFALINHYGPTESTVVATSGAVTSTGTRAPDIGAAIANTRVHLLDRALRPVPVGLPGELCVAGTGLARGYRGRPGLTAERFVPDPLGEGPGERLYRTGDLARWLPGGRIEFLGRIDHQVKIRGVRIELGEIESALTAQPEIAAAAVVVREEETGDRRLVAYIVAPAGLDPAELRERLVRRLPAAMIPAAWVPLDALPLTPNGKVDRRALPAPEPVRADWEFVAPRTPVEEQVAEIWRTVLAVGRVGVHDNFWDLGGHSLLATKVLARIRDAFGVDLPLKTLFTSPSLGELTAALGQALLTAHAADAADLLSELDGLSEEEIRALLAAETQAVEELT